MAGKLLLNFLLGSSLCLLMASAEIPTADTGYQMSIANTTYYRAANSYSSLTFKIPSCLQTIDPNVDQIMIVASKNTNAITTDTSFPAGVYVVDKFAVPPCNPGSNMDSVYRLGANAKSPLGCVSVPQPPPVIAECNPPLANGTQYSVNAILYVRQLAVKQLGWSDPARTLSTRLSRDDISLPPGGRSGGMVVITVILTVLMALLIVILVGAILGGRK